MSESANSQQFVAARLERVPFSSWHARVLIITGVVGAFAVFDALAITSALPPLFGVWHLRPQEIKYLFDAGLAGNLVGAAVLSYAADRVGRVASLRYAIVIFSLFSLCCAMAWNYDALVAFRFLQGLGIGAIYPLAAVYIVETSGAHFRGRMVLGFHAIVASAIVVFGLIGFWIVANWGWRSLFVIGALPLFLALSLRCLLSESPRWLEGVGRLDETDRALAAMEQKICQSGTVDLPDLQSTAPPRDAARAPVKSLLETKYLRRTLLAWLVVFCASTVSYGLATWLPRLERTVYNLPLRSALEHPMFSSVAGAAAFVVCFFIIDLAPRRSLFWISFLASGTLLVTLGLIFVSLSFTETATLATLAVVAISFASGALHVYIPEIYPTRVRALGSGLASVCSVITIQAAPFMLSALVAVANFRIAVECLGVAALASAAAIYLLAVETQGRALEDISP